MTQDELRVVDEFLRRWHNVPPKRRHRLVPDLPVGPMRTAAIHHPDPWVRRGCLSFLDHYANDESTPTFLDALDDPVPPVREMALHSLSCERCRDTPLCVADVVPVLARVLRSDPSPDVRHKTIPILLGLAGRDPRARDAIVPAVDDTDELIRRTALAALEGRHRDAHRSRHDLARQRRTRKGKAQAGRSRPDGFDQVAPPGGRSGV